MEAIKMFFMGYFNAFKVLNSLHRHTSANELNDILGMSLNVHLGNGGTLTININSGICPAEGRVVFAACYPSDSWFDVYSTGVVGSNRHLSEINEYGECRVSFQSLCEIIESYGGIVMQPVATKKLTDLSGYLIAA